MYHFRLQRTDGTPAEPPRYRSSVLTWRTAQHSIGAARFYLSPPAATPVGNQVGAERRAFRRRKAWRMNTAPTVMTSQSQRLKPSSTPSATVRTMIKVKAAIVAQLLKRECDSAT